MVPIEKVRDIILKYVYFSHANTTPRIVVSSSNEDNHLLLSESKDVIILKRDGISLKTNGRVNLNLYSYYVKK